MRRTTEINSKTSLEDLVRLFQANPYFFMLDSSRKKDSKSRHTYLAFDPVDYLEIRSLDEPALEQLNAFYEKYRRRDCRDGAEDGNFRTGFLSFLSYDLGMTFLGIKSRFRKESAIPHGFIGYYPVVIAIDEETGKKQINWEEGYEKRCREIQEKISSLKPADTAFRKEGTFQLDYAETYEDYEPKIEKVRNYIYEGDVYQINYTRQFEGHMEGLDSESLYFKLRKANPAPFSAYIRHDGWAVLSSSPERLVKSVGNKLETRPIKGTIAVSPNPFRNRMNIRRLRNSEKDKSELLMIVDLERNDLSRCSISGTVRVEELYTIESYETVHHLVATITSMKEEETSPFDVLSHVFPGGSITGTPKRRAVEIIDELEERPRGLYTGSIGFIDQNGNFDFNIAIRTILTEGELIRFNVGGGITWKSKPLDEFLETEFKGLGLKRGLGLED